ncbi:hypothetical protein LCGC14_1697540 [marine sediment metagenome]|uniref:Uncharacterized protein n=1 Tax=marine sediment metagenome TaxID=412755 RepID=A0A0F9HJE5_9ZZZZ
MTDLLLLGILIMQVIIFHNNAPSSGRYMKLYDILTHRVPKYLNEKFVPRIVKYVRQLRKN